MYKTIFSDIKTVFRIESQLDFVTFVKRAKVLSSPNLSSYRGRNTCFPFEPEINLITNELNTTFGCHERINPFIEKDLMNINENI